MRTHRYVSAGTTNEVLVPRTGTSIKSSHLTIAPGIAARSSVPTKALAVSMVQGAGTTVFHRRRGEMFQHIERLPTNTAVAFLANRFRDLLRCFQSKIVKPTYSHR